MKRLSFLVLAMALILTGCGGSSGGGGGATSGLIEDWDLRYTDLNCKGSVQECFARGTTVNPASAPGTAMYVYMLTVTNPGLNMASITQQIYHYDTNTLVYESTDAINFSGGQGELMAVYYGFTADNVDCGRYQVYTYVSYSNGSSTQALKFPLLHIRTSCHPASHHGVLSSVLGYLFDSPLVPQAE